MADNPVQVFIAVFGTEEEAGTALKDFQAMDRQRKARGCREPGVPLRYIPTPF